MELILLLILSGVGALTIGFFSCAWLSPKVLDWLAAHADARAFALRQYRMTYATYVETALRNRANNATQMEADNGVQRAKLAAGF